MARVCPNKSSCFVMFVCFLVCAQLLGRERSCFVMPSLVRLFLWGLWGEQVKFYHVRLTSVSLL